MKTLLKKNVFVVALSLAAIGCGESQSPQSQILVSDVEHTPVKRQSIGNCWIYAVGTWAESLHLSATDEVVNLSESYWTYWHFYNQLVNSSISEIQTGGNWWVATNIISRHGYMLEGDFIPREADLEMSAVQAGAVSVINSALSSGGSLASRSDRTQQKVMDVLDSAFGVHMNAAQTRAKAANLLVTGKLPNGQPITLADSISANATTGWQAVFYPVVNGRGSVPTPAQEADRKKILKRVMKAVNDYQPVIMSVYIDFNGLDKSDSSFKLEKIAENGGPGKQGGHMVVLEDYVVDNVADGRGHVFSIEEGDVSPALKAMAVTGDVRYLKIKNSWGTHRPDRGIIDGYHRFYADYLDLPFEVVSEGRSGSHFSSALNNFILPAGY